MEKRFLCYQQHVITDNSKLTVGVIIRNIGAKTKEEALGKFILGTSNEGGGQKLDPICIELDTLMTID